MYQSCLLLSFSGFVWVFQHLSYLWNIMSLPSKTWRFSLCTKHEARESTNLPVLTKLGAFCTPTLLRTKGQHQVARWAKSAPNLHKIQPSHVTAFPPSSLMSPQKAAPVLASLFPASPSPEVLAGSAACPQGESRPETPGSGWALLLWYCPRPCLAEGSLACCWAGAQLRASCSHLIKCLLTSRRHFDILGRTERDKDYKKNILLL